MPGFDRTGPRGNGPMTGGRRGLCASRSTRISWPERGRGFGRGAGLGRGGGFCIGRGLGRYTRVPAYYDEPYSSIPTKSRDQEIDILKDHAQALKQELKEIESRISGLQKQEN